MMRHKKIFQTVLFLVLTITVNAQNNRDFRFYADASELEVLQGNTFTLTVTVENGKGGRLQAPEWEKFGFDLISSSQSSSMSIINGAVSASASYDYLLAPRDTGYLQIPALVLENEGQRFETNPIFITVLPNPEGVITNPPAGRRNREETPPPAPARKKIRTSRI